MCSASSQEVDDPNLYEFVKRVQEDQRNIHKTLEEMLAEGQLVKDVDCMNLKDMT